MLAIDSDASSGSLVFDVSEEVDCDDNDAADNVDGVSHLTFSIEPTIRPIAVYKQKKKMKRLEANSLVMLEEKKDKEGIKATSDY